MIGDAYQAPQAPEKRLGLLDHIRLSLFWFGFNFVWGALLGPLLAEQMKRLAPDHPAGAVGFLYFAGAVPPLVVPLIAGPLSDRCTSRLGRRRPYIGVGGAIAVFGLFLMALAYRTGVIAQASGSVLPLYFTAYVTVQVGMNVALAAYMGVIPDMVPEDQRGAASGYYAVMSQLGTLLGIVSLLFFHTGAFSLLALGSVLAVITLVTLIALTETPLAKGAVPPLDWGRQIRSLWIDPRNFPDFGWVWLTRALMMLGFYSMLPVLNFFMHDVVHARNPAGTAAKVTALVLIGATITGYLGGVWSDRIGRKRVVVWSSVLMAATALGIGFSQTLLAATGIGVLFGLGLGAYTSVDWALGTDVLPDKSQAAKDMSVWHISMVLPQQIGPILATAVIIERFAGPKVMIDDRLTATYAPVGYMIVFTFAALCFFLSGILVRKVKGST